MTEKLSKLHHDGHITDEEYDRIKKAINSLRIDEMYQLEMEDADSFIPMSVVREIRQEILDRYITATGEIGTVAKGCLNIIDKHIGDIE